MKRVYFDNAATTAVSPEVIDVMLDCLKMHYGNPSSIHAEGRKVRALIEEARKKVARHLGASIGEIFFTSGGTEANNMAIKCAVRDLGVTRIITSPLEHHCVLHTVEHLNNKSVEVFYVKNDNKGTIDYEDLENILKQDTDKKTLVSLMHANNEIGTLLDIERVSMLCQLYNALFHSDTVQTIAHLPIDVSKIKINFLSCGAHKFHGPKGVGFIYINGESKLKPFIDGGAQERNVRGGTENVSGIIGLSKAMDLAYEAMDSRKLDIQAVRSRLKDALIHDFEDIQFNGDLDNSLYTVLSVSFPDSPKSDLLLWNLDVVGISASGGSACSSGAEGGSHVINGIHGAIGRKTIRFSFSHYNTAEEVDFVVEKLKTLIQEKKEVNSHS